LVKRKKHTSDVGSAADTAGNDSELISIPLAAIRGTDEPTRADFGGWIQYVKLVASGRLKSGAHKVELLSETSRVVTHIEAVALGSQTEVASLRVVGGVRAGKYKLDRRMGENIWGRPKTPVNRREYGPGQHGQRRKGKMSDFGLQLRAKQKLKGHYGDLTEKQFRRIYAEAVSQRGDTGETLIGLLERRLDSVVYRAKFLPTIFAARQMINHGHVYVNGKKVSIPSYTVKEGDLIELGAMAKEAAPVLEASRSTERETPEYIDVDYDKMTVVFVRTPSLSDVPYAVQMEPNLVVQFYDEN